MCDMIQMLLFFVVVLKWLEVCTTLLLIGALHCRFFAELFYVICIMNHEIVTYRAKK